jgi:hypothetical protein
MRAHILCARGISGDSVAQHGRPLLPTAVPLRQLYCLLLHWAFKTFFNSVLATTIYLLCRPWFFFTTCLALYSEFYPRSDAYRPWLFSLFSCCRLPPSLSTWRRNWWNVETFLQWVIPSLLWLLILVPRFGFFYFPTNPTRFL